MVSRGKEYRVYGCLSTFDTYERADRFAKVTELGWLDAGIFNPAMRAVKRPE